MYHEKTVKRENGDRVIIRVNFYVDNYSSDIKGNYMVSLGLLPFRKRKVHYLSNGDNYTCRAMNTQDREKFNHVENLKYVSEQEILEAKMELWELLKP